MEIHRPSLSVECLELAASIIQACQDGRTDEAEAGWDRMQAYAPLTPLVEVLPVYIMLARGQTADALRFMNSMPDDFSPPTRAFCLRKAGDPTWQGIARELEDSEDPAVRAAMLSLHEMND